MKYFYSDPHYGHKNIIEYCNRPFEDVTHMNETMIERYNSVVTKDDISICVGDFAISSCRNSPTRILERLNGFKILVKGNHDKHPSKMVEMGFDLVVENMVMHVENIGKVFFRHYPTREGEDTERLLASKDCRALVHGHIHNNKDSAMETSPFRVNVSVEVIDYTPVSELQLSSMIKKKMKSYKGTVLQKI